MTILAICLTANGLLAQEYKVQVENSKSGKLILNDFTGDFPVEGYNGNEIIITGSSDRSRTPERAKGLKPVYAAGTDNTGIGLEVEKNGNTITITNLIPFIQRSNFRLKVPNNLAIKIESGCERSGDISIQNFTNEVEVNNCQSIELKNVSGPLVLSTISGDINIVFSDVNKDKPTSIASVSGTIDITLPSKMAVDLEMGTISGAVYSDFDFSNDKDKMKRIGGNTIKTKLNGGGADLKINSVSGDVYLRKG